MKRKRRNERPLKRKRRLLCEALEDRRLLATLTVNSLADNTTAEDSLTTLREAILLANLNPGSDTITFDASVFNLQNGNSLIRLSEGELEITDTLTVEASPEMGIVITGDASGDDALVDGTFITDVAASFGDTAGAADDLLDDNSRVLNFSSISGDLTLTGLTLTGGHTTGDDRYVPGGFETTNSGGGIRFISEGALTLTSSTVSGNSTTGSNADGGGIFTRVGDITLSSSTISGNSTTGSGAGGGGISTRYGGMTLSSSTVSGNSATGYGSSP